MSKKNKQPGKFVSWLNTGIFPASIIFTHNLQYDEIMKELLKIKVTAWYWHAALMGDKELIDCGNYFALKREVEHNTTGDKKTLFYIIIKEKFLFTDYEFCKLAHEVLHICQFMLKDFLDRDREFECEAYLHTHIMQQCLKELRQQK